MRYQQFVNRVQELGGLASRDEAQTAVEAVLETLGERLSRKWRHHLAAQLAAEMKEHVLRRPATDAFGPDEFCNRVGARADLHHAKAERLARSVAVALWEAVEAGELEAVFASLPEPHGEYFSREKSPAESA